MRRNVAIHPIVLAGGAGKRLWPVSRHHNPKPFAISLNDQTLFEATIKRVRPENGFEPLVILGALEVDEAIREGLTRAGQKAQVFLEPAKRDTGPAVVAAALIALRCHPQAIVACLACDHHICNERAFLQAVRRAAKVANEGYLTVIGILPNAPECRFGYILPGTELNCIGGAYSVSAFKEKPDAQMAEKYVKEGYLWNSGNFIFRADVFLSEAERLAPKVVDAVKRTLELVDYDSNPSLLDETAYASAPRISVDCAIMERTQQCAVVPGDFDWSDLGTWQSVKETEPASDTGNVVIGDAVVSNVSNSYIKSAGNRLVAVSGIDKIVVVDEPDALLVCPLDDGTSVKLLFDLLEQSNRSETSRSAGECRPWGTFRTVFKGPGFQTKYIKVMPGGKLSMQKHAHRAEHWVVVEGIATVTVNDKREQLGKGEHAHIPLGAVHRLENETNALVAIMEIQLGEILSEDDIIRLEDVYDRV